jgi:hypothetical protein
MPTYQRRGLSRSKLQTLIRAAKCVWPSTVLMHAVLVLKFETGHEKGLCLPRKVRFTVLVTSSKTQSAIHTEKCFWPSTVFMHAESVWKHEMGHEKGLRLLRYLRSTVVTCTARKDTSR